MQDYFSLFGLPESFGIDLIGLEQAYRRVQAQVHPDRFAGRPESERRVAMQWATLANEAHRTLRDPVTRARYLLARRGHPIDEQNNAAMSPAFLAEQMEWREAVEEGRGDPAQLYRIRAELSGEEEQMVAQLEVLLDVRRDDTAAAEQVRRLMFLEKLHADISDALAAHDK